MMALTACGDPGATVATRGSSHATTSASTTTGDAPSTTGRSTTGPPTTIVRHLDMAGRAKPLDIDQTSAIAVSQDGSMVIATEDGTATAFLNGAQGASQTVPVATTAFYDVAVADDPPTFYAVGRDRTVVAMTWNGSTWSQRWQTDPQISVLRSVVVAPDGSWVTAGSDDGFVTRWDTTDGSQIGDEVDVGDPVAGLAVSPDGTIIAALLATGGVAAIADGTATRVSAPNTVGRSVVFADNRHIIGSGAPTAWSLDVRTGEVTSGASPVFADGIDVLDTWSRPDGSGRLIAAAGMDAGNPKIVVWDPERPDKAVVVAGLASEPKAIAFAADGSSVTFADFRQTFVQPLLNQ